MPTGQGLRPSWQLLIFRHFLITHPPPLLGGKVPTQKGCHTHIYVSSVYFSKCVMSEYINETMEEPQLTEFRGAAGVKGQSPGTEATFAVSKSLGFFSRDNKEFTRGMTC